MRVVATICFERPRRYEHLRVTRDGAFVAATQAFRTRRPARWACPVCLLAFPLYGGLRDHLDLRACCRRAPALGPDSTPQAVDAWNLAARGLQPPEPKFIGHGHHGHHHDHRHQHGSSDPSGGASVHATHDNDDDAASDAGTEAGTEAGSEAGSGSETGSNASDGEADDEEGGRSSSSSRSWFGGKAKAGSGKGKQKKPRAAFFWDPSGGLSARPKALGGGERPYYSGLHPPRPPTPPPPPPGLYHRAQHAPL